MQLKKLLMPLMVILLMGMTTTAFAQLTCSVSSTPVSRATQTGHTEPAGDLTFTCAEGTGATDDATFTIDFLAPITNDEDYPGVGPAGGGVSITNTTGVFAGAGTVAVQSINHETGQVVLTVEGTATVAGNTSTFTLTNVLVSLVDVTTGNLRATVSVSPGDNISIVANQDSATVISAIRPGLGEVSLGEGPARWLATGAPVTPATSGFTVDVEEGYIDSFRAQVDAPNGAHNSTMVAFEFTGIPDGAEIECQAFYTGGLSEGKPAGLGLDPTDFPGDFGATETVDADDNILYVGFTGTTDLAATETLTLDCGEAAGSDGFILGDAEIPLIGAVTVRVTLAPTGEALDDDEIFDDEDDDGMIPRFEEQFTDAITVLAFTPATTTMIVPLIIATPVVPAPFGSYDTGIAIANTTSDPFDDDLGGAFAQSGTITFYFFPTTGDPFTVTAEQLAGSCGLDSAGSLPTGRTFICNTSEILREGARTTAFQGYAFIVANFTNAHGTGFIYGGTPQERFTSATDVLVINPPAVVPRLDNPEPTFK
jgi:hypothetical protein